ncbi:uncharacterized protein BCR38DRAFT_455171 [Pseudomassariella vexata]|uniref:DUF7924 domain-containing protein n=1 Tax=Pseudomassariella vexata TaxID=1141098 RepID=A0A1Y2EFP2_9PEZI|nr:uncharacterized protein BCR38DRAFT_455171 [Pseudomassariella vexata]ORY70392.1 hypothetical protein BCR38DRAFT_455171 [Pseudomassariella vexata]
MAQTRAQRATQTDLSKSADQDRKRTIERAFDSDPRPSTKHPRISRLSADEKPLDTTANEGNSINSIDFWRREGYWPRHYFEPDMKHQAVLARKRSSSVLRSKRSISVSSGAPSDEKPREGKSAQYRDQRYETLLATKGSFMVRSKLDVTRESKTLCTTLLKKNTTCQNIHNKNEVRVIQDISRLIVPSAESLATYGSVHLEILAESVNEGWNNSVPLTGIRPQPDYSVGFQREAFTAEQLEKLSPFIGDFIAGDLSYFMATYYMHFPFLTCEVKCGAAALDVADRQNAHSMTLAVRGITELFRLAQREEEVNRQILAFSISHDHQSARIYGYYPVIDGKDTKYYRHPIRNFCFTELDGKEKWAAYQFTKNVYEEWMPGHFKRICSAIDQLPLKPDFDVPALSETSYLSQSLASQHLAIPDANSISPAAAEDDLASQSILSGTSFSKPGPAKRRKSPVKKP